MISLDALRKNEDVLIYTIPIKFIDGLIYPLFSIAILKVYNSTEALGFLYAYQVVLGFVLSMYLRKNPGSIRRAIFQSIIIFPLIVLLLLQGSLISIVIAAFLEAYVMTKHYLAIYSTYKTGSKTYLFESMTNLSWIFSNIVGALILLYNDLQSALTIILYISIGYILFSLRAVLQEGLLTFVEQVSEDIIQEEEILMKHLIIHPREHHHTINIHFDVPKPILLTIVNFTVFLIAARIFAVYINYLAINNLGEFSIYLIDTFYRISSVIAYLAAIKHTNFRYYISSIFISSLSATTLYLTKFNEMIAVFTGCLLMGATYPFYLMYQNIRTIKDFGEEYMGVLNGFRNIAMFIGNSVGGLLGSLSIGWIMITIIVLYWISASIAFYEKKIWTQEA